jgi:hypothetical protein
MGFVLAATSCVFEGLSPLLNALPPTARFCEFLLQSWITLCFFLVLTTCLLIAVYAGKTTRSRCLWLPSQPSAFSSDNDHDTRPSRFHLSDLLRKRSAGLEASVTPSSITEIHSADSCSQAPMSQTLTAIAHPLASKVVPPQLWQRDIPPYRLQARPRGSTLQFWHQDSWSQSHDQDFPPLRSPKRDQAFPSLKQQQTPLPPKARQWDRNPLILGPQVPRISNKYRKIKYKPPPLLNIPTFPYQPVDTRVKQPYEAFLVLDIEGTCELGTDFNYPNEIIVSDFLNFILINLSPQHRNSPYVSLSGSTGQTKVWLAN